MLAFILHVCTKARQPLKNALRTLESRDCLLSWQAALFREVASLEAQLAQAQADREESRNCGPPPTATCCSRSREAERGEEA